ncbi:MAG: M28 family peptidase [Chloroflexi bacterium]|nr:M28 family peptidase [Chloroflexota bacterium]
MSYVRALEGQENRVRGDRVISALDEIGVPYSLQVCKRPKIRNIIVDFDGASDRPSVLFSAHYDCAKGSPGASDNASGVAVLLGLCRELKGRNLPVRVVFFDREEAWLNAGPLRCGLLGSMYYVVRSRDKKTRCVYNLEACGSGDTLATWPVKPRFPALPAVESVAEAAARLSIRWLRSHVPWYIFSSDHQSFRWHGLNNAITLSLFPSCELDSLKAYVSRRPLDKLRGGRKAMPRFLRRIHSSDDTSAHLDEASLRMMLSLLLELVNCEDPEARVQPA